jgi:hypothetical protein
MKCTLFLYPESAMADAFPAPLEGLTREFDSVEAARGVALAEADKPTVAAGSFRIECEDNRAYDEQWSRKSGKWERVLDLHSV